MILIFGGAHQGKLAYAMERFGFTEEHIYHCSDEDANMPEGKKIIYGIDRWVLALVRADMDVISEIKRFIKNNEDVVVICNDISCGVVPACAVMRKWREETGRAMGMLARHSQEAVRLFCGIPGRVK